VAVMITAFEFDEANVKFFNGLIIAVLEHCS
jgi:hypothetical protein